MVIVRDPTQEIIDAVRLYVDTFEILGTDRQLFMETNQFPPTPQGFMKYFKVLLEEYDVHTSTDSTNLERES
jgi:hypothetical protein